MNEKPGDLRDRIEELEREQHAWKMLDEEREAEIARLREREAQLEQAKAHQKLLTLDAEARVARLERQVKIEGDAADANGRDARAAEARAEQAVVERRKWQDEAHKLEARVARLEEALREIEQWPHKIHTANEITYLPHHVHEVARRALAHEEEK